jgi:hypothetical protein
MKQWIIAAMVPPCRRCKCLCDHDECKAPIAMNRRGQGRAARSGGRFSDVTIMMAYMHCTMIPR